jgi:hypothetical protein
VHVLYFFVRRLVPSGTAAIISLGQTFITNVVLVFLILLQGVRTAPGVLEPHS